MNYFLKLLYSYKKNPKVPALKKKTKSNTVKKN